MTRSEVEHAEKVADRARAELLRTLDELAHRRARALDLRYQLRVNWPLLAAVGGVLAAVLTARVLLARRERRRLPRRLQRERARALARLWAHPERTAPVRSGRAAEIGGRALTIVGTAMATQLSRRLARRVIG